MPTYEYICEKCGHTFEKFQSIAEKPLTVCPEELCARKRWGKGKVHRAISGGAGFLFKGSGFYITDYRSPGYREAARKESGSGAATEKAAKSDSGGSTSKPAATPTSAGATKS